MPKFMTLHQVGDDPDTYHVAVDHIAYVQQTAAGSTRVYFHAGMHVSVREPAWTILELISAATHGT
ncbi:MAG: hypothetical protein ABIO39_12315 [Caulobacteraceae bacterium]